MDTKSSMPRVESSLRHQILKMPEATYEASGIVVNGRRIKSFVFTTDLAIIRNCDADAVFAVYPFTPQQAISEAIIKAAYVPVFCGVGGGTTKGLRTVRIAKDVESQGAMGVVLNAPISNPNLIAVARAIDIPVVITVVTSKSASQKTVRISVRTRFAFFWPDTGFIMKSIFLPMVLQSLLAAPIIPPGVISSSGFGCFPTPGRKFTHS